jgi:hypothetical protein
MSFLNALGKILKVADTAAPAAISAINPAAGAITGLVLNSVVKAEQAGGTGPAKKEQVLNEVLPAVNPLIATVLQASGVTANMSGPGVEAGIGQMVDGVVTLLNAIQTPAAAPASGH